MSIKNKRENYILRSFAFIIYFISSSSANSEVLFKDYERIKNTSELNNYLEGLGRGYTWANSRVEINGSTPLFCPPSKLPITLSNYSQILEKEAADSNSNGSNLGTPIELLLLDGLIHTFPCN